MPLGVVIKIDQDVAAENDIESLRDQEALAKIGGFELNQTAEFGADQPVRFNTPEEPVPVRGA